MYIIEIGVGIGFDFLLSPLPIVAEQVLTFAPSILHEMAHSKSYNLQKVETGPQYVVWRNMCHIATAAD